MSAALPRDAAFLVRTMPSVIVSCLMAVFAIAVMVVG